MPGYYLCDTSILDLSHSTVKIYSFLRSVNNNATGDSFYKRSNIAAHCGVSESTVVRAMRELRAKGLLLIKRRFLPGGQQTSNSYILIDAPQLSLKQPENSSVEISCAAQKAARRAVRAKSQSFRCSTASLHLLPSELKVYAYLSLRAGKNGKTMPAKKEIATGCGVSVSTVSRAIQALRRAGLVEICRQTRMQTCGNNGNSVNLYILRFPEAGKARRKPSRIVHDMVARFHARRNSFYPRITHFLPQNDTPAYATRDTLKTIPKKKATLKQRKNYMFSKITKRRKYAGTRHFPASIRNIRLNDFCPNDSE